MDTPLRLGVIIASTRPERLAPVVAGWFLEMLGTRTGFVPDVIDLQGLDLPADLTETPDVRALRGRLGAADAFVVVTSEYNHGYPGSLKIALDSAKHEWRAKPIGFVSYGGLSGGLRAVEQLRQVVAELHMVSVRDSVSFAQAKRAVDADGRTSVGAAVDGCARMLGQLAWWATALRAARTVAPYPG